MDTMQGLKRTHYCTELSKADAGSEVVVCRNNGIKET